VDRTLTSSYGPFAANDDDKDVEARGGAPHLLRSHRRHQRGLLEGEGRLPLPKFRNNQDAMEEEEGVAVQGRPSSDKGVEAGGGAPHLLISVLNLRIKYDFSPFAGGMDAKEVCWDCYCEQPRSVCFISVLLYNKHETTCAF
jgi:hypothetical protein